LIKSCLECGSELEPFIDEGEIAYSCPNHGKQSSYRVTEKKILTIEEVAPRLTRNQEGGWYEA